MDGGLAVAMIYVVNIIRNAFITFNERFQYAWNSPSCGFSTYAYWLNSGLASQPRLGLRAKWGSWNSGFSACYPLSYGQDLSSEKEYS